MREVLSHLPASAANLHSHMIAVLRKAEGQKAGSPH